MNYQEYLVVARSNGTTRNGSPYVMLKVASKEETLNINVWDVQPNSDPVVGQLVSFVSLKDNAGKKSCSLPDMVIGKMASPGHPLYNLLPRPIAREEWDACIDHLAKFCSDTTLVPIIRDFADKLYRPYSEYPAANNVHHAYPGGLLNHTHQMLHMFEGLYPCLPYPIKPERVILAILFHDYGKVYEYNRQGDTQPDMYLLGHIFLSAHKLNNVLDEKGIEKEEVKRIVHCVLAHHGTREFGSPVVPCTQEASIVNYLDNISAKTDIMEGSGNMEQNFFLGTHVVK
ncbi:MAG: HD domain-containing protein [Bacteroidaceae bacterium]|nr:HD domain-containing protein [Bacteroidaceae bacterium]